jgi:hypothetical protein
MATVILPADDGGVNSLFHSCVPSLPGSKLRAHRLPLTIPCSLLLPDGSVTAIGSATTDERGLFSYEWTPPDENLYRIVASFGGDGSYESSVGMAELTVNPAPTPTPPSTADVYTVPGIIGIIIAIVVVGLVIILMLRKR